MAIHLGGDDPKAIKPVMNVTPLVDVVLVLLIIFMVITPLLNKTFWVHTPKQDQQQVKPEELGKDPNPPLVLTVAADRSITVNGTAVGFDELSERLRRMFAARDDHVLFFDAANDAPYGFAVEVLDRARDGGAITIAALTAELASASQAAAPN